MVIKCVRAASAILTAAAGVFSTGAYVQTRPVAHAQVPPETTRREGQRASNVKALRALVRQNGPTALLNWPEVRDEVKLTPTQAGSLGPPLPVPPRPAGALPPSPSSAARSGRRPAAAPKPRVDEPRLTRDQERRLGELALQLEGPLALADPAIQDSLQLFPDQRLRIANARRKADDAWGRVQLARSRRLAEFMKEQGDGVGFRQVSAYLRQSAPEFDTLVLQAEAETRSAAEGALRQLTRRQRAAYQKMLGKPFPVEQLVDARDNRPPNVSDDEPVVLEPVGKEGRE
jgi:hypothetical protein